MDKLRKFAERLWYNKERMVLAVMLVVFGWNVYKVMYPPPEEKQKEYRLPKGAIAEDWTAGVVSPPPAPRPPEPWDSVHTPNPFWYLSGQRAATQGPQGAEDAGISLLRIKPVRGGYRAQLQTANKIGWYDEGEQFETFELLKIDPDAGTCQVRSEHLGKVIPLKVP